ncbi:hypothetical protein QCA50_002994 [Cerrena zonata]|uniref:5'-nucleotidase n=1 Tax=Cerrena zonata TaxID=2478898 RepID=A0AAW0GJ92_9APHY
MSSNVKTSTVLGIAHFNDVYQVSDQKINVDNKEEVINVTKFATLLSSITSKWKGRDKGGKDGLIIFSGDLFSPSIESSTTRGRHMPPIANGLGIDVGVAGNHEFDFGYPRLKELINDTAFPWLLSNIVDTTTGKVPEPMKEFYVLERVGVRIGFVGLVEKDWIATITGWPENFNTMICIPNDIELARALCALSPDAQKTKNIASEQGVDLLLGGHDHVYWISKGVTSWDGYDLQTPQPDAADDQGDVLIVKSGTDFQDLSEVILTLQDTPPGSIRKKIIKEIKGQRHVTRGDTPVDEAIKVIVDNELKTIQASMQDPICDTEVELDVRSSNIRVHESAVGNWVTDCMRHAHDEALIQLGYGKADGVIASTGNFRGDRVYKPGRLTLGDLMTMLPFPDPSVVVELDANALWDALESAVSRWPSQEGRFPALSGLRMTFDGSKPPGQRVLEVWLLADKVECKSGLVDKEQVLRSSTRKYLIMVGEYMVQGGDGYDVLKGQKQVLSAENGQSKSTIVRKFLLGAQMLKKTANEQPEALSRLLQTKPVEMFGKMNLKLVPPAPLRNVHNLVQSTVAGVSPVLKALVPRPFAAAALILAEFGEIGLLDSYERRRSRMRIRLQVRSLLKLPTSLAIFAGFLNPPTRPPMQTRRMQRSMPQRRMRRRIFL